MRMMPYICMGGVEIGNGARFIQYIHDQPKFQRFSACDCDLLLPNQYDAFTDVATDPAPWYDPNVPASEEFLGFFPGNIQLGSVFSREMSPRTSMGAVLSAPRLRQRVVSVQGTLAAASASGMQFGERWLSEVLRGCCNGCNGDDLLLLPTCPDIIDVDPLSHFRTLVDVGLIDYVPPSPYAGLPENRIQQVAFQLASQMPYLYGRRDYCMEGIIVPGGYMVDDECCVVSTDTWPGDGATLRITVEATGGDASDVTITARPTFDGDCPPDHAGMPCFTYRISQMDEDGILTIDGRTQRVTYWDPSSKKDRVGFPLLDPYVSDRVNGDLFVWPDIAPCTDLCICVTNEGFEPVTISIESFVREL